MSEEQKILVIDTAMKGCGVAVYNTVSDHVYDHYHDDERGQAQFLVPLIQDVLKNAELTFEDLTEIVVCPGPGTFTGIRIGLSVAKTLGLVLDIPVWGISSLQALALTAQKQKPNQHMLVLVETKRQDFYTQRFTKNAKPLDDPASALHENIEVKDCILIGDAVARFDPAASYHSLDITRIDVSLIAKTFAQNSALFTCDIAPIYLRSPDVSQPKNPPRIIQD